ncbi:MAG: DMT family transporter [Xanthomonadales bacterium]|nr:DMT family transporter [Xanthomonadales bacterium]MCW5579630.1 DMT family transporter [Dokdonella sp.]MDL1868801.1 DMT family transporter [Gammaproteobacteria bacterium PRO6]
MHGRPALVPYLNPSAPVPVAASALPRRAIAMMVTSTLCFGVMAVLIRIASHSLHAFEIAFLRSLFGALAALPLLLRGGWRTLYTDRLMFYVLRCAIGAVSMLAGFWAIAHLPLAQAIALSYSSPLFVTIGAVIFLGEVVRMRRWSAVVAGFIGVLVIVRPGSDAFTAASLVALFSAACSGAVTISIKFLSRTDPVATIVLLTTWLWVPLSLPAALAVWQWPSPGLLPLLVALGVLGTAGQYFWTHALRLADASTLAPFSYLQLVFVAVLAWLMFAETPDRYTVLGAGIVIGASLYIARREARLARQRNQSPPRVLGQPAE